MSDVRQVSLQEEWPKCTVQLCQDIIAVDRQSLLSLLQEYKDVFVFGPEEMPSIAPTIMKHQLNIDPHHQPVI